jgi:hypothetical protein
MHGTRTKSEREQLARQLSEARQMVEESRKAIERARKLVDWRTLEAIRANAGK